MMMHSLTGLILICLISTVKPSYSFSPLANSIPINEKLYMSLDRNVYCVDETVYFRIFNTSNTEVRKVEWSNVVNVEIITPEGRSVAQGKFPFTGNGASGSLYLSKNILSGNYYIRAYTKWMRNQPPKGYFYESVKIINPYRPDILTPILPFNEKSYAKADTIFSASQSDFSIDTAHFDINQMALVKLSLGSFTPDSDGVCVSLVKKGSVKEGTLKFGSTVKPSKEITFIPELQGVTVSGKVINKLDSLPIPYAKVWITLQTKEIMGREVMCDEQGEFSIDLGKNYGSHNLFVSATSNKENQSPSVLIDNDYSFSTLNLPFVPFEIKENEKSIFSEMSINSQLNSIYHKNMITSDTSTTNLDPSDFFYGKPTFTLNLKDFISLPTVSDYFKELIPMVTLKKEGDQKVFHILGPYPELLIYDPLVMVDMVKITDIKEILGISPSLLNRIEVVQNPYLRGDITYGGIIHFISKNNDFAQIELPEESVFVSYNLLDSAKNESIQEPVQTPVPFVANCLYWNSALEFDVENNAIIEFNTGSEPGTYELKLEGINEMQTPYIFTTDIVIE